MSNTNLPGPPAYVAWLINSRLCSWNRFLFLESIPRPIAGLKFQTLSLVFVVVLRGEKSIP